MAAKLDRSQWVRLGAAIAILALAAGILLSRSAGSRRAPAQTWFLDLQADTLIASDSLTSPVTLPSGAQAVRAHVYSCGSCDDPDQRMIVYVEKTLPVDASVSDEPRPIGAPPPDSGVRISDDRGATWHSTQSLHGQSILTQAEPQNACPDPLTYRTCKP